MSGCTSCGGTICATKAEERLMATPPNKLFEADGRTSWLAATSCLSPVHVARARSSLPEPPWSRSFNRKPNAGAVIQARNPCSGLPNKLLKLPAAPCG